MTDEHEKNSLPERISDMIDDAFLSREPQSWTVEAVADQIASDRGMSKRFSAHGIYIGDAVWKAIHGLLQSDLDALGDELNAEHPYRRLARDAAKADRLSERFRGHHAIIEDIWDATLLSPDYRVPSLDDIQRVLGI